MLDPTVASFFFFFFFLAAEDIVYSFVAPAYSSVPVFCTAVKNEAAPRLPDYIMSSTVSLIS